MAKQGTHLQSSFGPINSFQDQNNFQLIPVIRSTIRSGVPRWRPFKGSKSTWINRRADMSALRTSKLTPAEPQNNNLRYSFTRKTKTRMLFYNLPRCRSILKSHWGCMGLDSSFMHGTVQYRSDGEFRSSGPILWSCQIGSVGQWEPEGPHLSSWMMDCMFCVSCILYCTVMTHDWLSKWVTELVCGYGMRVL